MLDTLTRRPRWDQGPVGGSPPVRLDFLDPEVRADPWPVLARLRATDPVHRAPNGSWIVTRHADVGALNRDPRLGRDLHRWRKHELFRPFVADSALERSVDRWMMSRDRPDHTRMRTLVSSAFTPRAIARLQCGLEALADGLIDRLEGAGEFDYVGAIARPLSLRAIGDMLSFPPKDYELLMAWTARLVVVLEPAITRSQKAEAVVAAGDMTDYVRDHVRGGSTSACGGLLGQLRTGACDLSHEEEVVANIIGMFVASAANTIVPNEPFHLLTHPQQFDRVRADPSMIPLAVEELLRFDSRGINARVALEDLEVGGRAIGAGEMVLCMLGGANRDPEVFDRPHRLVLGRHPNPHLTFGGGIHHCLGAALTRLEAQIMLDRLVRRWKTIELDPDGVVWLDYFAIRSVAKLPVQVTWR